MYIYLLRFPRTLLLIVINSLVPFHRKEKHGGDYKKSLSDTKLACYKILKLVAHQVNKLKGNINVMLTITLMHILHNYIMHNYIYAC